MYVDIRLDLEWFLDDNLTTRELRLMLLLEACRRVYNSDEFSLSREWICEQLHWKRLDVVSKVSAALSRKHYLDKNSSGNSIRFAIKWSKQGGIAVNGEVPRTVLLDTPSSTTDGTSTPLYKRNLNIKEGSFSSGTLFNDTTNSTSNMKQKRPTAQEILDTCVLPDALKALDDFERVWQVYIEDKQSTASSAFKTLSAPQEALYLAAKELIKGTDVVSAYQACVANPDVRGVYFTQFRDNKRGQGWQHQRRHQEVDAVDEFLTQSQKPKLRVV